MGVNASMPVECPNGLDEIVVAKQPNLSLGNAKELCGLRNSDEPGIEREGGYFGTRYGDTISSSHFNLLSRLDWLARDLELAFLSLAFSFLGNQLFPPAIKGIVL